MFSFAGMDILEWNFFAISKKNTEEVSTECYEMSQIGLGRVYQSSCSFPQERPELSPGLSKGPWCDFYSIVYEEVFCWSFK